MAAVVRSAYVTLYVDGQRIGRERYDLGTGTPLLYSPSHPVYLATNAQTVRERFFGLINQVAIFRRALRASTVNAIYQSGIAP